MGKAKQAIKNITFTNLENSYVFGRNSARKCTNNDWSTIGFDMPREDTLLPFVDKELRYNCIYFLFITDRTKEVPEKVYVGQASIRNNGKSVIERLKEHIDNPDEQFSYDWNSVAVFTNEKDTWNREDLDCIESIFYDDIPAKVRLNRKKCAFVKDRSIYEDRVEHIKKYLAFLGYSVFQEYAEDTDIRVQDNTYTFDSNNRVMEDISKNSRINEYITPLTVVRKVEDFTFEDIKKLNKSIDEITFWDMACKGGEFLKEVYDRLMNNVEMIALHPNYTERSNHILMNQIYGVALSPVSKDRATKKLLGFGYNIKVVDNYIEILKGKKEPYRDGNNIMILQQILDEIFEIEEGKHMHFDVILGNPPYQDVTTSIYQHFINMAIALKPSIVNMIVKNNWLTSDTMSDTRDKLINFGLKDVINYSVVKEVFPSVGVAVSIFNAQKEYSEPTHIMEIRKGVVVNDFSTILNGAPAIFMNELECSIATKANSLHEESFRQEVYPQEAFRITSVMGAGRGEGSYTLDFEPERSEEFNVGVLCQENGIQYYTWIRANDVPNRAELINKYKVVACAVYNYNNNPITSITGLSKGTVCNATFAPLFISDSKELAYGAYTYIRTKFFRFLVKILCTSGITHHSEAKFNLVPTQDFTKTWTDTELYSKYRLTQEEINYIEKTIKTLD